jgi:hypothetical protein
MAAATRAAKAKQKARDLVINFMILLPKFLAITDKISAAG